MSQDQTKKEALFNEVKGSLFEYLVAKEIAIQGKDELGFQQSLDKNYLTVLSQQDRMVRQFYPEMLAFLSHAGKKASSTLLHYLKQTPASVRVVGKFSNSPSAQDFFEADLILGLEKSHLPVSLKLNKKNAFVNTKSGGIKSFFSHYFSFIHPSIQDQFNKFVDLEFNRMALELHALHDLEFVGNWDTWIKNHLSELPGELDEKSRAVLKSYYARIAHEMHKIFEQMISQNPEQFKKSLPPLLGFGSQNILQMIYFHDFPSIENSSIDIHSMKDLEEELSAVVLKPFTDVSSVEFEIGHWSLQVRVKPMNKFTTTAIKINCSIKVKRPSAF